ncbi:hypothetical protein BOX15_Mlig009261g1 [Macrostomum lignano]|uniref:Uncharacterized protein n=2 Tax=Macrostomum lignano TaxID=282301 RepID=A0A267GIY3_9PLAT|nr:hypothetical protein BOX15_Mlig009261g2 [Macrostomum lignano]PAA89454.1 hypothetical protein BOX15_Mlig009261g1 [Macrostomum lignano]
MPRDYELNRHIRYEVIGTKEDPSAKAQKARLAADEAVEKHQATLNEEWKVNMKSDWEARCQARHRVNAAKAVQKQLDGELKCTKAVLIEVRKEALRQLLERERSAYAKELEAEGKTFYTQRA